MGSKMLIDASHPEETRVVVIKGNRIEEFDFESAARRQLKGNIYLAKVTRVEPSLQAAFVEYGGNRHGFLAFSEIHPDYYQIPLADRMALLQEEEEQQRENDEDEDNGNGHSPSPSEDSDDSETDTEGEQTGADFGDSGTGTSAEPGGMVGAGNPTAADDRGDLPQDGAEGGEGTDEDRRPPGTAALSAVQDTPRLIEEPAEDGEEGRPATPLPAERDDEGLSPDAIAPGPSVAHGVPGELGNGVEDVEEDPENQKVELIGAEDALEEVPQRRRKPPRRQYKIQEVIKRRQVILVQVVKEERGNKGAALTTYLSLAGRYCVLMPNTARGGGISRKITDAGDRRRLKEVAREIEVPPGMGLIVRTAGAQRTKTEIKRDYDYLLRLWESVRDLTLRSTAPALVYEEGSLVKRAIRDLYTKDVDEVIVEGEAAYREAKDFMKMLMPSHAKNVKLYKDSRPLFSRYQAESQLDALYSPTVTLPSGGYMVINQTEALVAVDINSGKATREHNIEDTALKTNLEAADEIARQLRLRDLAGLVVIDFIDMEEKRNNRSVERRLKEALKNDRARIQVGRISHFGLLEMSRQRLRPGLLEGSSRTCPHCEGRGVVRSVSSCGLSVLRAIEEHLIARKPENLTVKCAREVAFYILNEKRDNLLSIETTYGISVFVMPSDDLRGSQAVIERATDRSIPPRKVVAAPIRMDSTFQEDEEDVDGQPAVAETPGDAGDAEVAGVDADADADATDGEGDTAPRQGQSGERPEGSGRRRRRRRGRRGGRGREEQPAPVVAGEEVPGLGEQPDVGPAPVGRAEGAEPEADAAGDSGEAPGPAGDEAGSTEEPVVVAEGAAEARPRRERWTRRRDRGARPEREDGTAPAPAGESTGPSAHDTAPEAGTAADVVASTPAEPVAPAAPAEPPRRWQPPAPTIQPDQVERKVGWWSRR